MNRQHVVFASVWALCLGGGSALVACGGSDDDSGSGTTTVDSGGGIMTMPTTTSTSTPPADAEVPPVDGNTTTNPDSAVPVDAGPVDGAVSLDAGMSISLYAGRTAAINVAGMTAGGTPTYSWTLSSAPAGSAVSTASIINPTTATPSLPTDRPGTYVLNVTATSGTNTAQAVVTITAVAAHVVFTTESAVGPGALVGISSVDTDGTGAHPIICGYTNAGTGRGVTGAIEAVDTFEGNAGTATKVAFGTPPTTDAGTSYSSLYVTDTTGSCPTGGDAGANARLVYTHGDTGGTDTILHPRFSPDGTKIAFATGYFGGSADTMSTINVIGADGTGAVSLGTISDPVAATNNDTGAGLGLSRQPEWMDATHVGWTRKEKNGAATSWSVVVSTVPPAGGDPVTYMTCPETAAPARVAFLAGGTVLTIDTQGSARNLVVYKPDATTKACTVVRTLSNLVDAGTTSEAQSAVQSFAVSPDGTTVAYTANDAAINDGGTPHYLVYTTKIDGSGTPVLVGGMQSADLVTGIRWVSGGGLIAFTHSASPDGGGARSIAVTPVTINEAPNDLYVSDGGVTASAVGDGDGTGCNTAGKSSALSAFLVSIGAVGIIAALRRRRSTNAPS